MGKAKTQPKKPGVTASNLRFECISHFHYMTPILHKDEVELSGYKVAADRCLASNAGPKGHGRIALGAHQRRLFFRIVPHLRREKPETEVLGAVMQMREVERVKALVLEKLETLLGSEGDLRVEFGVSTFIQMYLIVSRLETMQEVARRMKAEEKAQELIDADAVVHARAKEQLKKETAKAKMVEKLSKLDTSALARLVDRLENPRDKNADRSTPECLYQDILQTNYLPIDGEMGRAEVQVSLYRNGRITASMDFSGEKYLLMTAECREPRRPDALSIGTKGYRTCFFDKLDVPKKYRGLGLAKHVMQVALNELDKLNIPSELNPISLGGITNRQLIAFYEGLGFVLVPPKLKRGQVVKTSMVRLVPLPNNTNA